MNVNPETIGSLTITPPPYSLMNHAFEGSGSSGSQYTASMEAGFP